MASRQSLADAAAPRGGIAEHDLDSAFLAIRVAMRDRRVGIGTRAAAIDYSQRVTCAQGFHQLRVAGDVERPTIDGDDQIASPDRGRLEAIAGEGPRQDPNDDCTFRILAQAKTQIPAFPGRFCNRRGLRSDRAIGAGRFSFEASGTIARVQLAGLCKRRAGAAQINGHQDEHFSIAESKRA